PAPGTAPAWFTSMGTGSWATIAGGSGQRVGDRLPSVLSLTGLSGESPTGIMTAWTGGAVDQSRREFILCANGGHADYSGNEAYALSLGDATPAWRRICDPTPKSQMPMPPTNEGGGVWNDGRPRAMHSTFEVFGDGRVWFPLLNSVASPGGGTVNNIASFNRSGLGNATSPLAYASGMGPWAVHGAVPGLNPTNARFGRGLFDRNNHYVYGLGGFSANSTSYWRAPTQGGSIGVGVYKEAGQSFGNFNTWAVCAHDLGIIVAGDSLRRTICVLTLANFGASNAWTQVSNVSGTGYFNKDEFGGAGGVYIQRNHTIAIGDPRETGKTIYKLQIPVSGSSYNPGGQWVWSAMHPGGSTPVVDSGNSSANSKWNIIEDMGNGQAAIVFVGDINGPTYVYKVPVSGL
ncbi:MAG: hypothetical protein ABI885_17065, partial [Gammaproteobacteria bacterium]